MKKLLILLLILTSIQADKCTEYKNKFQDILDDIKMAIELKSKDEAKYFAEEAYESILDLSSVCTTQAQREDIKIFRKLLNQQKIMLELLEK